MANIGKSVKLGVFTLAIMNVTAVVSLRGLPAEAEYGVSSAFYYLFAALVFLIPTALVAAELAAMFQDKQGGVFRWVGEAFGKKAGFLAIWLQWIESTIWYPTVLTFGAVAIAFIGMDHTGDMLLLPCIWTAAWRWRASSSCPSSPRASTPRRTTRPVCRRSCSRTRKSA